MSLTLTSRSLNLNVITESNDSIQDLSKFSGTSYSYYSEALHFINEMNSEYRSCCRDFYVAVGESTSVEVVNESFESFKDKVKEIIKKFLNFVKKMVDRFIVALHKFVSSDSYLKKNKDKLALFTDDDSFEMKKYVYTNIDKENFPNVHALITFEEEYNNVCEIMDNITSTNAQDKLKELDNVYSTFMKDLTSSYEKFRSTVINPDSNSPKGAISESEFDKEIFDVFRDGGDKQSVTVGPDTVTQSLVRFNQYADTIKVVKRNRTNVEKEYKEIQNKLDSMMTVSNGSMVFTKTKDDENGVKKYSVISDEFTSKLELYVKAKIDQIINMSNIHTMALSGKLDAVTECYKADKALLYKALSKVTKAHHESVEYFDVRVAGTDERDAIFDKLQESLRELDYTSFVLNEMYSETQHADYLNSLLEGTGVTVVNEAGKIKKTISRIIQAIGKAFGKFTEFMSKLFKNDHQYLENYKDIILKKPVKSATIDGWYNYDEGLQKFVKLVYPAFNYEAQKTSLANADTWYKTVAGNNSGLDLKANPDIGVSANILNWLKGAEVSINANTLNMSDLYMYVYDFDTKIKPQITKDITSINQASKNATSLLSQVEPENNTATGESVNGYQLDNSFISRYFTEAPDIKPADAPKSGSTGAVTPNSTGSVANTNTNITNVGDKDAQDTQNNNAMKADASQGQKDQEAVSDAVSLYFQTAKEFLTAKLNFATEVYNSYFKIIRWHVQQYNNKAGKDSADTVQKQTTNYGDNSSNDDEIPTIDGDGNVTGAEKNDQNKKSGLFHRKKK